MHSYVVASVSCVVLQLKEDHTRVTEQLQSELRFTEQELQKVTELYAVQQQQAKLQPQAPLNEVTEVSLIIHFTKWLLVQQPAQQNNAKQHIYVLYAKSYYYVLYISIKVDLI